MSTRSDIHLLTPAVADRIAAGEVIERPASLVKELVENSLDARATLINVGVGQGGRWLRVADNGTGIPAAQVPLAFQRFATSKISDIEDLWSLETMGFRGEALASIAAVSKLEAFTRPAEQPVGTSIRIEGGQTVESRAAGGAAGTVVEISDLFYNTPARLKFLRQPATEFGHIVELLTAMALSHPEVSLTLVHEDREVFATLGTGQDRDVVRAIYGREVARDLLAVQHRNQFGQCLGLISTPAHARKDRSHQFFFINRRWVRFPPLGKVLSDIYGDLLSRKRHPVAILSLVLPPDRVDVNVHPTKREVRLQNSQGIFSLLHEGIRGALYRGLPADGSMAYGVRRTAESVRETSSVGPGSSVESMSYSSLDSKSASSGSRVPAPEDLKETTLPYIIKETIQSAHPSSAVPLSPSADATEVMEPLIPSAARRPPSAGLLSHLDHLRVIGQVFHTYILAEGPEGLYMVDQHAAHERVRYERLLSQAGTEESITDVAALPTDDPSAVRRRPYAAVTQPLLTPLLLDLSTLEMGLMAENRDVLSRAGMVLEEFGERTLRVLEVPLDFPVGAIEGTVRSFLQDLRASGATLGRVERLEWLRKSIACQGAIKAGRPLEVVEMQKLLGEWARTARPQTCPHGRPVFQVWPREEINKRFWR